MASLDQQQLVFMESEDCILVTENDEEKGRASKKHCHIWTNIDATVGDDTVPCLHRAFSVFLFNSKGQLLLQQRATEKITFPDYWTNTCCSHPLFNLDSEREMKGQMGVRNAAHRKLEHELGIPQSAIDPQRFNYLTRILYKSPSGNPQDSQWGEHEVDYCLFYVLNAEEDAQFDEYLKSMNLNEVRAVKFVDASELLHMLDVLNEEKKEIEITPWFKLICRRFLFKWWDALLVGMKSGDFSALDALKDFTTVHKLN
ncbi:isopentenyl diphosphate isomerase [Naegleria gruberi]|uniref:isopentenyl-diphosphate Delta-isomerase n=1 Tax=Naegleria gruberi TaxID=5762 RepID=D2VBE2_NAEGR|nr:isopentenyl diphosphate isomerase [Naegleria gruberi]EFC45781.1 isopentenyl diphosphate isomerase [Naegleria gruberi]|eukprot:XP_002678525.1 isopentenyl diphosphate isomerase [Naegleria gruberi strain NEG-M]